MRMHLGAVLGGIVEAVEADAARLVSEEEVVARGRPPASLTPRSKVRLSRLS